MRLKAIRPRKAFQDMLCGYDPAILCLFEYRETADVRIGEEDAAV